VGSTSFLQTFYGLAKYFFLLPRDLGIVFISILLCSSCSSVPMLIFLQPRHPSPPPEFQLYSIVRFVFSLAARVWEPTRSVQICPSVIPSVSLGSRPVAFRPSPVEAGSKFPFFSAKPKARRLFSFPPSGVGQVFALPLPIFARENPFTARSLCPVSSTSVFRCCPCDFGLSSSICFSC
jgi:hypothetical protein